MPGISLARGCALLHPIMNKRGSLSSKCHRIHSACSSSRSPAPGPNSTSSSHGPRRRPPSPQRPRAPVRCAAAAAPGSRQPARGSRSRGLGAALPVLEDCAGHPLQEHPECAGDARRTSLHPNRSRSHPQEWTASLSQPRGPHY